MPASNSTNVSQNYKYNSLQLTENTNTPVHNLVCEYTQLIRWNEELF